MFNYLKFANTNIYKTIFGYDIFISYSRMDSMDYTYAIAQYFQKKGFECYIDQLTSSAPGKELPLPIKNAVINSTSFILIGSLGAKKSYPIKNEIETFLIKNKNKLLIPISINNEIDNNCIWFDKIEGLVLRNDSLENLKKSSPSEDVLNKIEGALNFTKKGKRLRQVALSTFIAVLLIISSTIIYSSVTLSDAKAKVENADQLAAKAKHQEKNAKAETRKANSEKVSADSLKAIAFNEKKIAEKQKADALLLKSDAEKMAKANSLASSAFNLLKSNPTKSFQLSLKAFNISKTPEVCNALISSYLYSPFYNSIPCNYLIPFPDGKMFGLIDNQSIFHVIDWNGKEISDTFYIQFGNNREMVDCSISTDGKALIVYNKFNGLNSKIYYFDSKQELLLSQSLMI